MRIIRLSIHPPSSVLHRILDIRLEYDRTAAICEPHMDLVSYMVDGIKIAIIPRTLSPSALKEVACDLQVLAITLLDSFHALRLCLQITMISRERSPQVRWSEEAMPWHHWSECLEKRGAEHAI